MRSSSQWGNASLDTGNIWYFSWLMALIFLSPRTGQWLRGYGGEFCRFTVFFAHSGFAPVTGLAEGMNRFNRKKANLYIVRSA
jgi:hypothetical protein